MTHTLSDALDLVVSLKRFQEKSEATVEFVQEKSAALKRTLGAELDPATLTAASLRQWVVDRQKQVCKHTVHKELVVLRQALKCAFQEGWIDFVPEKVIPIAYGTGYVPRKEFVPREQWGNLLAQFTRDRAAHIAFMIATGAELSASLRAKRADIDMQEGLVWIDGRKRETRRRYVAVNTINRPLLERVLRDAPGDDPLFRPWGKLWRDLHAGCRRAGLPEVGPNDLRRTFGSILVQAGVPFEVVAKQMGHKGTKMLMEVYGQLRPSDQKNIIDGYLNTR